MSNYEILPYSYHKAKELGVKIVPSKNPKKKIDVLDWNKNYICSIGDIKYNDFPNYVKEKGLDSQDIKYVINSIISAIDLSKLDDEDRDDILDKLEEYDEYDAGNEGDLDLSDEEDLSFDEEPMPGDDELPVEEPLSNPTDEIKTESMVEKVLTKYFDIKPEEKPILEEKKKKDFLKKKLDKISVKKEIEMMSESVQQRLSSFIVLKENENAKFIGKTNKENLLFSVDGKQIKVTPRGRIL
jgi:hypothetical protein